MLKDKTMTLLQDLIEQEQQLEQDISNIRCQIAAQIENGGINHMAEAIKFPPIPSSQEVDNGIERFDWLLKNGKI